MSMVYWLHADSKHGREGTNKDLTCKKLNALLACTFETTLVRSSSSLFPTEEEHNNQHYHSQHLFFCIPFIKHSVFKLHLIFLSKDTILFFLHSLKMILSSKTLYTLTFLFFITFNKILSWIRINRGYKHKDENILKMRKQNFLISK